MATAAREVVTGQFQMPVRKILQQLHPLIWQLQLDFNFEFDAMIESSKFRMSLRRLVFNFILFEYRFYH